MSIDIIDGIRKAKEMLEDFALEEEEEGQPLPTPSAPENITLLAANDRIVFVEVFIPPYRNEVANKAVTNCIGV